MCFYEFWFLVCLKVRMLWIIWGYDMVWFGVVNLINFGSRYDVVIGLICIGFWMMIDYFGWNFCYGLYFIERIYYGFFFIDVIDIGSFIG